MSIEPPLDERPPRNIEREREIEADRADSWHDQESDRTAERGESEAWE